MSAINPEPSTAATALVRAGIERLARAGFNERAVAQWWDVPLATDARYVPAPDPETRARRGLGAWIALLVAGETVPERALGLLPEEERAAFAELGLVEAAAGGWRARVALLPWRGLAVASDRLDSAAADAVGAPDLSAINVAASLPAVLVGAALDVGCGAGLLTLVAARAGADALGSDIDAGALVYARLNARLNGARARFVEADLLGAAAGRRFALVIFNAPLLRAPLAASDPHAPARYTQSPRGEALALEFLDGLAAHLAPDGEALLHAQLTPAVEAALATHARSRQVISLRFATALDGTPHALTSLRPGAPPERRSVAVPLGPLCRHLTRELLDAYAASRALSPTGTPLAASWLELRSSRQLAPPPAWRALTFGGAPVDEADVALLERLRGPSLAELALDDHGRVRLERLIARGLVVLK